MNEKVKHKVVMAAMILWFVGFAVCCFVKSPDAFSDSERRTLAQFPKISLQSLWSGSFMEDFEDYAADQIPFRDSLRSVKAITASSLMMQRDNHGIYVENGYVSKMEYPMHEESAAYAAKRFAHIYEKYLEGTDANVYVSIIPDKNYFMAEESGHLSIDYDVFAETFVSRMEFAEFIDIYGLLSLEDYYKTDTHWRQERILDVAQELLHAMGADTGTVKYEENILDRDFYGVYYGQAALPLPAEEIRYLTSGELSGCRIYDYENNREMGMYDFEKGHGKDPYELFLSGSLSLITIENPNAGTDKELLLFRDSFGSSIAPLLAEGYSKITLVDIRYLHPDMLEKYIEFDSQDVLFLYSTLVLNHAETIK